MVAACWLAGCGGGDPTATDPLKVFADGFLSNADGVVIEAEGGTIIGGYDAWLRLMSPGPLEARFGDLFESMACDAPVAYFTRVAGADGFAAGSRLSCRAYHDDRLDIPNGRWLVEDEHSGRTWFRVWKGRDE